MFPQCSWSRALKKKPISWTHSRRTAALLLKLKIYFRFSGRRMFLAMEFRCARCELRYQIDDLENEELKLVTQQGSYFFQNHKIQLLSMTFTWTCQSFSMTLYRKVVSKKIRMRSNNDAVLKIVF